MHDKLLTVFLVIVICLLCIMAVVLVKPALDVASINRVFGQMKTAVSNLQANDTAKQNQLNQIAKDIEALKAPKTP